MNIVDAIKKGFGAANKNLILVVFLFVFNLIWNMINITLAPQAVLPAPGEAATPPVLPPQTAFLVLLTSVLFILLSVFMQGGSMGVVKDYIKEGKAKLGKFASYGLKYYLRLFGLGILIILFVLIVAIIAALIIALTTPLNNVVATVIASIVAIAIGVAGVYMVLLLVLSPYSLICDDAGVIVSMKKSMRIVRKAFLKVLLLLVLLVLIAIGIGFLLGILTGILTVVLPAGVGQIIIGIVNSLFNGYFGVVMIAAFMTCYLALAEKEKSVAQKVF